MSQHHYLLEVGSICSLSWAGGSPYRPIASTAVQRMAAAERRHHRRTLKMPTSSWWEYVVAEGSLEIQEMKSWESNVRLRFAAAFEHRACRTRGGCRRTL